MSTSLTSVREVNRYEPERWEEAETGAFQKKAEQRWKQQDELPEAEKRPPERRRNEREEVIVEKPDPVETA